MRHHLERLTKGALDRTERRILFRVHARHFTRRVQRLDRFFFPGCEKNPDAVRSLCHHAYGAFLRPARRGELAPFVRALDFRQPESFLYYWQDSATIRFLRGEGPDVLHFRCRIRRNVHLNLRSGFIVCGARAGHALWGLPEWTKRAPEGPPPDVESLWIGLRGLKGRAQVRAVLQAASAPLTRAQIADVIERSHGFATEVFVQDDPIASVAADQERGLLSAELHRRVEAFYAKLSPLERRILVARGYTTHGAGRTSFRKVAERLGGRTQESFRQKEGQILEAFRSIFELDELEEAARGLVELLDRAEGRALAPRAPRRPSPAN